MNIVQESKLLIKQIKLVRKLYLLSLNKLEYLSEKHSELSQEIDDICENLCLKISILDLIKNNTKNLISVSNFKILLNFYNTIFNSLLDSPQFKKDLALIDAIIECYNKPYTLHYVFNTKEENEYLIDLYDYVADCITYFVDQNNLEKIK